MGFAVSNGVEMLRQGVLYVEGVTISTVVTFAIHSTVPEDDKQSILIESMDAAF